MSPLFVNIEINPLLCRPGLPLEWVPGLCDGLLLGFHVDQTVGSTGEADLPPSSGAQAALQCQLLVGLHESVDVPYEVSILV